MSRRGAHHLAIPLGAMGLALGLLGCPPPSPPAFTGRPECPTDFIVVPRGSGYYTTQTLAAPGPISMVPEFHDCQRFMNPDRTSFGSLVAIFASYHLDTVPDVTPLETTNLPSPTGTHRAAATILNYGESYDPLSIEKGINCLYMISTGQTWSARIVSVAREKACAEPLIQTAQVKDLLVTVLSGPSADSVPPVARWDWDGIAGKQYIGIRCGTRWCEVHENSQMALNSSRRFGGSLQGDVKGWYDEQFLALGTGLGKPLVPGSALGTIIPVAGLANFTEDNFKEWQRVATVSLSEESPKYKSKFNFVQAPAVNEVSLCRGTPGDCGISAAETPKACAIDPADVWWAKIVSDGVTKYRCVIRRTHTGVDIPGVVRWRWQNDDDDMWIRCPEGCCEVT